MTFHEGMLFAYNTARALLRGLVYMFIGIFFFGGYFGGYTVAGVCFLLGYSTSVILHKLEKTKADSDGGVVVQ